MSVPSLDPGRSSVQLPETSALDGFGERELVEVLAPIDGRIEPVTSGPRHVNDRETWPVGEDRL